MRVTRLGFNLFPAYRRTGGRVTYIADDWSEVRIKLPLNWTTRNYVGTIFGGSMFGAVDPIYMLMFIKRLGSEFVVWDKAATIRFRRPGRSTLFARFHVADEQIQKIQRELQTEATLDRTYPVNLVDEQDEVHAVVEKTLHFRRKSPRR